MVSLTDSLDEVAQFLVDLLNANLPLLKSEDGKASMEESAAATMGPVVFYGDQEKLPVSPCICVDPGTRPRTLNGVSYTGTNDFTVYILVYHARVQDNQLTRKQVQQISEIAERLMMKDPQMGGLVIHCAVTENESGYVYRNNTMYRTNRITFTAMSRTRLR